MAHERIVSDDVQADIIVQWNDDGGTVSLGMMWDEPKDCSDGVQPGEMRTNLPLSTDNSNAAAVLERQVEGGVGGMIAVPVEPYVLRPYLDSEGRWSIYMHFDRHKVNGLIRTLRRARNKAFGADE